MKTMKLAFSALGLGLSASGCADTGQDVDADTSADLVPPPMEIVIGDKVPVPIDVVLVVGGGLALVARTIRKRRDRGR